MKPIILVSTDPNGRTRINFSKALSRHDIPVYATTKDWEELVVAVRTEAPIQMVESGLFSDCAIPNVDWLDSHRQYLIFPSGTPIRMREVPQRSGGVMYAIDQALNPSTLVISTGGLNDARRILQGQIGTVSEDLASLQLFKLFRREIDKTFERIKSYFVGSEAATLLNEGVRLTPTSKSPAEYDLKR